MKAYGAVRYLRIVSNGVPSLRLWLGLLLIVLAAVVRADEPDEIEREADREEPLAIVYAAPQTAEEIRAYVAKLVAQVRDAAARREVPLNRVRVHLQYFGREVPAWVQAVSTELRATGISVGENGAGRVERWSAEWDDVWPTKRARIARQQLVSELVAEFRAGAEGSAALERYATPELAEGILAAVDRYLSGRVVPGLLAIARPYLDRGTGLARPGAAQALALKQSFFFMTLTGVAACIQVMSKFGGDPNASPVAAIAVAAAWRFFFTYFKDAGNVRHQMVKYYRHKTGRVESSFWWSFASQLFDSLMSSFTFQAVLHGGLGTVAPGVLVDTLLTSVAGSFAKIPVVQFTGSTAEGLKHDTSNVLVTLGRIASRAPAELARELGAAADLIARASHQEALERVEAAIRAARLAVDDPLAAPLEEVRALLEGCVRVANKLWWTNAAIDFAFDLLKYGSLLGVASVSYTYWGLALAGASFLMTKHLLSRTHVGGVRDVLDMAFPSRIDAVLPGGAERLAHAAQNRWTLSKALRRTLGTITKWTGLDLLVGRERTERWANWLFRKPREDSASRLVVRAARAFRDRGETVPPVLADLVRGLAEAPSEERPEARAQAAEDGRYLLQRGMSVPDTLQVWLEIRAPESCGARLVRESSG